MVTVKKRIQILVRPTLLLLPDLLAQRAGPALSVRLVRLPPRTQKSFTLCQVQLSRWSERPLHPTLHNELL